MARVIWTSEALRNIDTIGDFLLETAPDRVSLVLAGIVAAVVLLSRFPRLGRMVQEIERAELREIVHESYHIVYTIDGQTVWIAAVLHGSMDVVGRLRGMGFED